MATYRKVPARILTVDYVGISSAQSELYRRRAGQELEKLEGQVLRGGLDQGVRHVNLGGNVRVEAVVCFNLKQATVIIGGDVTTKLKEKPCYCCSPCLVAGVVAKTYRVDPEDPLIPLYEQETDYFADIDVCQSGNEEMPKRVTVHEERGASGRTFMRERVLQSATFDAPRILGAAYSDFTRHEVGAIVLVLVQPLYGFTYFLEDDPETPRYPGEFMAAINQGKIAREEIENPLPFISVKYPASSGYTCQIDTDWRVWKDDPETPEVEGDPKYQPYRVLPIRIESCF